MIHSFVRLTAAAAAAFVVCSAHAQPLDSFVALDASCVRRQLVSCVSNTGEISAAVKEGLAAIGNLSSLSGESALRVESCSSSQWKYSVNVTVYPRDPASSGCFDESTALLPFEMLYQGSNERARIKFRVTPHTAQCWAKLMGNLLNECTTKAATLDAIEKALKERAARQRAREIALCKALAVDPSKCNDVVPPADSN